MSNPRAALRAAHHAHVSHLSVWVSPRATRAALSGGLWIPRAFRPPAFASWAFVSRWGVGLLSRSGYWQPQRRVARPQRGFHVPLHRDATGVGALYTPGSRCPRARVTGTPASRDADWASRLDPSAVFVTHRSGDRC